MAERVAFRMRVHPGKIDEYKKRHDEIWPELAQALRDAGVSDYSIWHDPETNYLFATLIRRDGAVGPAFPPLPDAVARLQDGLRRSFDPAGILNPGLMATDATGA